MNIKKICVGSFRRQIATMVLELFGRRTLSLLFDVFDADILIRYGLCWTW
jgi:hypothetical protein